MTLYERPRKSQKIKMISASEIEKIVNQFDQNKNKVTPIQVIRVCHFLEWFVKRYETWGGAIIEKKSDIINAYFDYCLKEGKE
jgi:hypothetical protein